MLTMIFTSPESNIPCFCLEGPTQGVCKILGVHEQDCLLIHLHPSTHPPTFTPAHAHLPPPPHTYTHKHSLYRHCFLHYCYCLAGCYDCCCHGSNNEIIALAMPFQKCHVPRFVKDGDVKHSHIPVSFIEGSLLQEPLK